MSPSAPVAGPSNPVPMKDAPPSASASGELSNRKKKRDAWQARKAAKLLANGELPSVPSPAPTPAAPTPASADTPAPSTSAGVDADAADAPQPTKTLSKQALKRSKRRQDKKARIASGSMDEAAALAEKEKLRLKHVAFKAKKAEAKKAEKAEKAKEKAKKGKKGAKAPLTAAEVEQDARWPVHASRAQQQTPA